MRPKDSRQPLTPGPSPARGEWSSSKKPMDLFAPWRLCVRICAPTKKTPTRPLPDLAAPRPDHRIAGLARERLGKRRHVGRRSDGSETRQGVRVHVDQQQLVLGTAVLRPDLRVGKEKPLLGREPINSLRTRLALEALLIGLVSERQAAEVRNALSEHQLAVFVDVAGDHVRVELLLHTLGALLVVLQVFGGPPVFQIALGVKLAPLVVKAVGHLMADDGADPAIVHSVVRPGVEEGRL